MKNTLKSNHCHTSKHPQTSTNSNQFSKQQNLTTIQDLQQKLKKNQRRIKTTSTWSKWNSIKIVLEHFQDQEDL